MKEYRFKGTEYMTAHEKAKVLHAWERFVRLGCRREDFTKALYRHLTQHCSFIAHYDLQGFYSTYFIQPEHTAKFFTQFDREKGCESVEYHGTWWLRNDYADLNEAMIEAAAPYIEEIYARCARKARERDIGQAYLLLAKHGELLPEKTGVGEQAALPGFAPKA